MMASSSFDDGEYKESIMAVDGKKVVCELDVIEKSWIAVSLAAKREQLVRSRNKEVTGSEIWILRGKEIEALNLLLPKFS